ncbi:MAG: ParB N-terminal domain-containing protein [candidate division WOR-3 bacterium]
MRQTPPRISSVSIGELPVQAIALDAIREEPGPYCMSFGFDLGSLIHSIERVGLIHPPLLRAEQGKMEIVTGYRRLMAVKAMNRTTVICRIVTNDVISAIDCLLLNLYDNLATRRLNDVEKGMVLSRLSVWLPEDAIIAQYLPLLGLRPDPRTLRFLLEIDREAGEEVKRFVAEEGVAWRVLKTLSELETPSRVSLLEAISKLRFNINQQLQFIDYIIDISRIENIPIPSVLSQIGLGSALSDKANRPQLAKAVLSRLRGRRYPTIVDAEKRFQGAITELNLPEGVRILPPPYFEGEHYRLEVFFREGKDLTSMLQQLSRITGLQRFRNPWDESS